MPGNQGYTNNSENGVTLRLAMPVWYARYISYDGDRGQV